MKLKKLLIENTQLLVLSIAFVLMLCQAGFATTYYVDSNNGNDSNTGTSETTSWKTIAKVNSSHFQSGDFILFKRRGVWREQLTISSSGKSGYPLTFGAYGTGGYPIISGADIVSRWTAEESSTYSATLAKEPHQIYYNDNKLTENNGATTSVGPNEWDWDSNTLYINVEKDPLSGIVEACQRDTAVSIGSNINYITLQNLSLQHGNHSDVGSVLSLGTHITIQNCEVSFSYGHGIAYATNATNNILFGCNIHDNTRSGVLAYKVTGSLGKENYISENIIRSNSEFGVYIIANYFIVEKNLIQGNGNAKGVYSGIEFFNGDDDGYGQHNIARYNRVIGQISGIDDGEGIFADEETAYTDIYGNVIYDNDGPGIGVFDANHVNIYNNVVYDNCQNSSGELNTFTEFKFIATEEGDTTYLVVKNNIGRAVRANTYAVYVDPEVENAAGLDISNNDWYASATNWYFWNIGGGNNLATWNGLTGVGSDLNSDPLFANAGSGDFTLQVESPCINAGVNLGASYDDALLYTSSWPDSVVTVDQDILGSGWEIGAYVKATLSPPSNLRIILSGMR